MSERASDHEGTGHHEGPLRRAIEHLEEHRHESEERRLREELASAGYDVEADTGIEVDRPANEDFDVEADTAEAVRPERPLPPGVTDGGSD
jgi:hypothetical protein